LQLTINDFRFGSRQRDYEKSFLLLAIGAKRKGKKMERIIREAERRHISGIPRAVWWRLEREGKVPRRVQISKRAVGWLESEMESWLREKAGARWNNRESIR
jgi:prophage regulatory protein